VAVARESSPECGNVKFISDLLQIGSGWLLGRQVSAHIRRASPDDSDPSADRIFAHVNGPRKKEEAVLSFGERCLGSMPSAHLIPLFRRAAGQSISDPYRIALNREALWWPAPAFHSRLSG
jgi:hypothetical protein